MALTLRVDDFGGVTCIPSPPRNCAFAALFVMRQEISDRLISIVNVSSEEILRLTDSG